MKYIISKNKLSKIIINGKKFKYYSVTNFCHDNNINIKTLPYFIRIMIEMLLRKIKSVALLEESLDILLNWRNSDNKSKGFPFYPSRVLLQDYTGIPLLTDLAAMRDYIDSIGFDPRIINPVIPTALVVDHSVIAEFTDSKSDIDKNMRHEFVRNKERYEFIKWGASSFSNFIVIPPGNGIVHQVNLEYLAPGVVDDQGTLFPDSVIGTDSHTTMINSISTIGWGVGGIEAEAAMLGQPIYINCPNLNGVKLVNTPNFNVTATDIALTITKKLREIGVVGEIVEFFGDGVKKLNVADRATISNMAPEYGALMGFFSIDGETLSYYKNTGRSEEQIKKIEKYYKNQSLFDINHDLIRYNRVIEIDLSNIKTSVSGPRKPEEHFFLSETKKIFTNYVSNITNTNPTTLNRNSNGLDHGSIVIAAITSCTNTANPNVMLLAALLAKNAIKRNLTCPEHVMKIFSPGSKVVESYLKDAGLLLYLEKLGFNITAFGCTACIGNIGNLDKHISQTIEKEKLIVSSVLSGNRNFDSRIHNLVRSNFLMSPPLVVAFALAGTINIDLTTESLGFDNQNDTPVFLKDIWPKKEEIERYNQYINNSNYYKDNYNLTSISNPMWNKLKNGEEVLYKWDSGSTYIKQPPFLKNGFLKKAPKIHFTNARALLVLGDSITTDHISPAGKILDGTSAANYLKQSNEKFYNTFGSRRGNYEIMLLGAFSNPSLKNFIASKNGPYTRHFPSNTEHLITSVAQRYRDQNISTFIFGGYNYGSGSSRDFASKVVKLLGVEAVIAKSFERIHRSNLIYMGILPCEFLAPQNINLSLFTSDVVFSLFLLDESMSIKSLRPQTKLILKISNAEGETLSKIPLVLRLDNEFEIRCFIKGGIIPTALEDLIKISAN